MHAKISWVKGIKASDPLTIGRKRKRKAEMLLATQEKIDKCLNCTKSAKECKGNCIEVE